MTDLSKLTYRPCVGIMLLNKDGMIFTGERLDMPGAWQMPQGGIDEGEDATTAALRELEEEIGVSPEQVTILTSTNDWLYYDLPENLIGKAWGGKFRGQKQIWYLMQLQADDDSINIDTDHPEFSRWRWSNRIQLIDDIVEFKKEIYGKVAEQLLDSV